MLAIAEPSEEAKQGDQPIDELDSGAEQAAPKPAIVETAFVGSDGIGRPDEGWRIQASGFAGIRREIRRLPHSEGKHAGAWPAQPDYLSREVRIIESVRRQLSAVTDQSPIPVDLIGVIDGRQQKRQIRFRPGYREKIHMAAVPCITRVAEVRLVAPGFVYSDPLPARVIQGGRGPVRVIAQMKLPIAVQRDGPFAQPLYVQRSRPKARPQLAQSGRRTRQTQRQAITYQAKYA